MAAFNIGVCISIVCFVGALAQCPVGKKKCGTTCCLNNQLCEESKNHCYASNSIDYCSIGIYYCIGPSKCCGLKNCCKDGTKCCGVKSCCPTDSVCCGLLSSECCPEGTTICGNGYCKHGDVCRNGKCLVADADFHWWYVVLIVVPLLISLCIFLYKRQIARQNARLQAAQNAVIAHTRNLNQAHASYDQPAYPSQVNVGYSQAPPPYSSVNAPTT